MTPDRDTSRAGSRRLALALAVAAVLLLAARYWRSDAEDFVYYYCAGAVVRAGASPYADAPYQACLNAAYGGANPNASRGAASAYPPVAMPLFRALAALPYQASYALWNAILLAASLALILGLGFAPEDGVLLALWPGFVLCWRYHKLTLPLLAAALAGLRLLESGRELAGGAALGVLALQPQWLAPLAVRAAARGKRRAFVAAAATAVLLTALSWRAGWLTAWLSSAATHAHSFVGYDNQSLFVAALKGLLAVGLEPRSWLARPLRAALTVTAAALAWPYARRKDALGPFLGFILLAQPYSHASDALWAFPFFLYIRDAAARRFSWSRRQAAAAALGAIALTWLILLFAGGRGRVAVESREGYLTCALALAGLALARRKNDVPAGL
ncbi:MAG: DUF2029 domain-containing protein [Elusimicrobia bacterium]|nr:DUF2029 domain-containing protein [Elusimicrobiota bacterium]